MKKTNNNHSLLIFPCEFPIKIVGKADLNFQAVALAIVRKHYPTLSEGAVTLHYSKENKYIALTVTIQATSQAQLDAIYQDLSEDNKIIMAM